MLSYGDQAEAEDAKADGTMEVREAAAAILVA
jgi:hypothetical protein